MEYLVLSRRWRPQRFSELVGQEHIVRALTGALSQGRVAHAYLFTGPRGVGKTTTARILAKALNCEKGIVPEPCCECENCREIAEGVSLDVVEIDGASNRGIDEIRALRENVHFTPSKARFKVYIIDEVHMLTIEAFNALLKTLEEPPEHVKFIFATTEPHKLPKTIESRCQRFDFHRLGLELIKGRLENLCKKENFTYAQQALTLIARAADGAVRDAESMLDQVMALCEGRHISFEDAELVVGGVEEEVLEELLEAALSGDVVRGVEILGDLFDRGQDPRRVGEELVLLLRDVMIGRAGGKHLVGREGIGKFKKFKQGRLLEAMRAFVEALQGINYGASPYLALEMALFSLADEEQLAERAEREDEAVGLEKEEEGREEEVLRFEEEKEPDGQKEDERKEEAVKILEEKEEERAEEGKAREPLTLHDVQVRWGEIIKAVEQQGKKGLAHYLEDAKLLEYENGRLVLATRHWKALRMKPNQAVLQEVFKEVFGMKLLAIEAVNGTKAHEAPEIDLFQQVVDEAREIFGAEVVKNSRKGKEL